jgi:hypothetical protein
LFSRKNPNRRKIEGSATKVGSRFQLEPGASQQWHPALAFNRNTGHPKTIGCYFAGCAAKIPV